MEESKSREGEETGTGRRAGREEGGGEESRSRGVEESRRAGGQELLMGGRKLATTSPHDPTFNQHPINHRSALPMASPSLIIPLVVIPISHPDAMFKGPHTRQTRLFFRRCRRGQRGFPCSLNMAKLRRFLLRYYPPGIILEYDSNGEVSCDSSTSLTFLLAPLHCCLCCSHRNLHGRSIY